MTSPHRKRVEPNMGNIMKSWACKASHSRDMENNRQDSDSTSAYNSCKDPAAAWISSANATHRGFLCLLVTSNDEDEKVACETTIFSRSRWELQTCQAKAAKIDILTQSCWSLIKKKKRTSPGLSDAFSLKVTGMTWNQDSQKPCAATYTSTLNAFAKKWDQRTMSVWVHYLIVWRHNARSCFESTNLLLLVVPVSWKAAISVCDWRSSTILVVALVDANMKVKSESHSLIWFCGRTRPSVVLNPDWEWLKHQFGSHKWWFPETGLPLVLIHFSLGIPGS